MTPCVFTCGGATLDCSVAPDGALALAVIGGNAIHAAAGARLMGASVGAVARVPEGWPVEALVAAGLDARGVHREVTPEPEPE